MSGCLVACGDDAASTVNPRAVTTGTPGTGATDGSAPGPTPGTDGGAGSLDGASPADSAPPDLTAIDPLAGAGTAALVKSGFGFTEGPFWRAATQDLLFSDISSDKIERFVPPNTFDTFRDPSGKSNGIGWDKLGLVVCEGGAPRRVSRTLASGAVELVVDKFDGKRFNSPNDVIERADGVIYFTDPDYSVVGTKELTFNGVFRVDANEQVHLVADDLSKPNGICLSPDDKTLYVADEAGGFVRKYDVASDGTTSAPQKLADVSHPDGMTVDDAGNLYVAVDNAIAVLAPNGTPRGSIPVPKRPTNCAFGGVDRKTLFITAQDSLYSIVLNVPGPP